MRERRKKKMREKRKKQMREKRKKQMREEKGKDIPVKNGIHHPNLLLLLASAVIITGQEEKRIICPEHRIGTRERKRKEKCWTSFPTLGHDPPTSVFFFPSL